MSAIFAAKTSFYYQKFLILTSSKWNIWNGLYTFDKTAILFSVNFCHCYQYHDSLNYYRNKYCGKVIYEYKIFVVNGNHCQQKLTRVARINYRNTILLHFAKKDSFIWHSTISYRHRFEGEKKAQNWKPKIYNNITVRMYLFLFDWHLFNIT